MHIGPCNAISVSICWFSNSHLILHAEVTKFLRSVTLLPVRSFRVLFSHSCFATCYSVAPLCTLSQLYSTYTCVWQAGNGFIVVTQRDESLGRHYVELWEMFYWTFLAMVISSNERRLCFTDLKISWYHGLRNKICEKLIQGPFMCLANFVPPPLPPPFSKKRIHVFYSYEIHL